MLNFYQVMIVDDEPSALNQLTGYVTKTGLNFHVVAKALSSDDAIYSLSMTKPDLIITDIRMPLTDGLQMLQLIFKTGWNGQVAIISGFDDFAYAQQAIRLGVKEYLLKPVFPEDIQNLLQRTQERFEQQEIKLNELRHEIKAQLAGETKVDENEVLPNYLLRAKDYIKQHYAEPLTLTQVGKIVAINPAYLSSRFAKYCGQNFIDYVTQYRLEKAQELLRLTNLQIQEVAVKVGYTDIGYFNRIFRRYTGQTPGAYRSSVRDQNANL
jgi:two-component system response regulator YesN